MNGARPFLHLGDQNENGAEHMKTAASSTTVAQHSTGATTPDRIMQYSWGFAVTRALASAIEVHLFTHIENGRRKPEAIAAAEKVPVRGIRMLLNAMTSLGLLERQSADGAYALAPDAAAFLVEGKPTYLGDFVVFHATLEETWHSLTAVVRNGKPIRDVSRADQGIGLWHSLVDLLFTSNYAGAAALGKELARMHPSGPVDVLDVAAGSGVWGIAAAEANPRVRVAAFDLEATLPHTRKFAERTGVLERFEFVPGDVRTSDFGAARYDVVILGHICHSEGEANTKKLFAKVARALKPGGTIAIAEFLAAPDRSGPTNAMLFALNMLVNTNEGDTFTVPELTDWLGKAGFERVREFPAPAPSPLLLATKS